MKTRESVNFFNVLSKHFEAYQGFRLISVSFRQSVTNETELVPKILLNI
jgi:hypothetical protein